MPEDTALLALIARWKKPKRKHTESNLIRNLCAKAHIFGMRLWRNQVGTYRLADGRWITSGLCVGSSDLIGFREVTITPEMVGQKIAVFVAIETKSASGRATGPQLAFIARVKASGGFAMIVRSERELEQQL
jgi:hypothetical protein